MAKLVGIGVCVVVTMGCGSTMVDELDQYVDTPEVLFEQDFDAISAVADYYDESAPGFGQFNHIGVEPNGGAFDWLPEFNGGLLVIDRIGNIDGNAGLTRWTDFPGEPTVMHVAFDLGVTDWTVSTSQTGVFSLAIGSVARFNDYGAGEVAANTFQTLIVKGEGTGRFSFIAADIKSHLLVADGRLHHVDLFLNKSDSALTYRSPDERRERLRSNGFALFVNSVPVVIDAAAANGVNSALTDMRIRWPSSDDATWFLDNFLVRSVLP